MTKQDTVRIGVDWGSTGFRAYLFDQHYKLKDQLVCERGIKTVQNNQYESTLFELIGDWLKPGVTVLLSGMITSRTGWVETPYLSIPTALDNLLSNASVLNCHGVNLHFLPGLSQIQPRADVMRGEELQLLGASSVKHTSTVILPGTHSKWVQLSDGRVEQFNTIITGELFDVLLNNTLIGDLAQGDSFDDSGFVDGVRTGFKTDSLVSEFFQCRAGVLLKTIEQQQVHSFLSGLLIGNEIREGLDTHTQTEARVENSIALVGSALLCERYTRAFETLNIASTTLGEDLTVSAFAKLHQQLALSPSP